MKKIIIFFLILIVFVSPVSATFSDWFNELFGLSGKATSVQEKNPIAGIKKEVALGSSLVNSGIKPIINIKSIKIKYKNKNYNTHEEVVINKDSPTIQTSLSTYDDDYLTDVYMEVNKIGSIAYYYKFDDKFDITSVTSLNPLKIKFLGKDLKITSATITNAGFLSLKINGKTYMDGDYYIEDDGICNNDPDDTDCWVWAPNLQNDKLVLGIRSDFIMDDDSDNPPGIGECISFPNDYISICLDSLTVKDTDYATYEIKYKSSVDFSKAGGPSSAPVIYLYSSIANGFTLTSNNQKTSEIWIVYKTQNQEDIYYKDINGVLKYGGNITISTSGQVTNIAKISGNINIGLTGLSDKYLIIKTPIDTLNLNLKVSENKFRGFGTAVDTAEACELMYDVNTCVGTKDEDHRTKYGIIIRDPKNAFSSDIVGLKLEVPPKQVKASVSVKYQKPVTTAK